MKTIKTTLTACALMYFFDLQAQTRPQFDESIFTNGQETYIKKDTTVQIRSFKGHNSEQKNYLSWLAVNVKNEGSFIIYRSADGENYEIIGIEHSTVVPGKTNSGYFFTDNKPGQYETGYYKVVYLSVMNTKYESERIAIAAADAGLATNNK